MVQFGVFLSCAHNTVELLVAVIRRAIHTTAVSFNMENCSTLLISSTALNRFEIFVEALVGGALLVVISRHEVAVVLSLPPIRTGNSSWNHKHTLLLSHLANSTGNITIGASSDWPLVFSAIDIVVALFSPSTLKGVLRIGGHA